MQVQSPNPSKLSFREKTSMILAQLKQKLALGRGSGKVAQVAEHSEAGVVTPDNPTEEQLQQRLDGLTQLILERKDILEVLDQWTDKVSDEMRHYKGEFHQDAEISGYIAYRLFAMIDTCLFTLREERTDENGRPFILCIDQVNNQDVLSDATADDRKKSVKTAIHRMVEKNLDRRTVHFSEGDPESFEKVEHFFAAAVSFAIITGGFDLQQAQTIVHQAIKDNLGLSIVLSPKIEKTIETICNRFLTIASEPRVPREFKPFSDLADTISTTGLELPLEDGVYTTSAELGPVLDTESLIIISPLLEANHISREEMITRARQFGYDYLGFPKGSLEGFRPPRHFTESKSGDRGIISREILIYVDNQRRDPSFNRNKQLPAILASIENQAEINSGWFLIRLSDSAQPRITFYSRLWS